MKPLKWYRRLWDALLVLFAPRVLLIRDLRTEARSYARIWWSRRADGAVHAPVIDGLLPDPPSDMDYYHYCNPAEIVEECRRRDSNLLVYRGTRTWSDDVVGRLVRWGLEPSEAIQVVTQRCERCLNALCYELRIGGYPVYGREYEECPARCHLCEPRLPPRVPFIGEAQSDEAVDRVFQEAP